MAENGSFPPVRMETPNDAVSLSPRHIYPQEKDYPWLSTLLDVYHLVDKWTMKSIAVRGVHDQIICAKGCSNCCKMLTVPINYLEFKGLSWYVEEVLQREDRYFVKQNLLMHEENSHCPFLVQDICAVYPLRPVACRQFFVLSHPCYPGENPWLKRKEDIFCSLDHEISWLMAVKLFPLFGIHQRSDQRKAFERGYLTEEDRPLSSFNWSAIGKRLR